MAENERTDLPWVDVLQDCLGVKEYPGSSSNPEIMRWVKEIGIKGYSDDSIAWCGLGMAWFMWKAGIRDLPPNPLWARDWLLFGVKCKPVYGAVGVFGRGSGGHVAILIGQQQDTYLIGGANQSDMVNITRIAKSRLLGARWPRNYLKAMPDDLPFLDWQGSGVSENEA